MTDQDNMTSGSIPPKIFPFVGQNEQPPAPDVSSAPKPVPIRLTPISSITSVPATSPATPAIGIQTAPPANPHATSRVPVPEAAGYTTPMMPRPVTVRVRPANSPQIPVPVADEPTPPNAVTLHPQSPPTPGSNPLPSGLKPPSTAQTHAAKSKTSRISLDSAIGVAPLDNNSNEPKTIRLKRPSELTSQKTVGIATTQSTVRQTSRIPDSSLPINIPSHVDNTPITQKKTLKIKRPGTKDAVETETQGGAFPEGIQMTPISDTDFVNKEDRSVFTTISALVSIAAAIVLLLLTWCLAAHAIGPSANKNALESTRLGSLDLSWSGTISR